MSFPSSSRWLASSAVFHGPSPSQYPILPFLHPSVIHRRSIFERFFGRKKKEPKKFLDPLSPDYLKRKPVDAPQTITRGDLAPSSIIDSPSPDDAVSSSSTTPTIPQVLRDPSIMAAALDPKPYLRKRWQRKMTIRDIRKRGRMSKTIKIARSERVSLTKSHMIKTSIKKLGPLARQIAGKPIEDAIVQMRFSKKKAAVDVKKLLEYARDEATVRRGMGLGNVRLPAQEREEQDGAAARQKAVVVEDRKGKKRIVTDRTSIYVDEAWVGRGKYGQAPDFRARGNMNIMRTPETSISIVLKEEATRIRQADERERKRQRKKVWVPLPDRPITAQRQYCLW